MKTELRFIAEGIEQGMITETEAKNILFRLFCVKQQRELLIAFLEMNNWLSLEDEENAKSVVDCYLKAINCG